MYTVCDFVMVRSKVNYVHRPLGVSIFSNVAPFEKSLDTPDVATDLSTVFQASSESAEPSQALPPTSATSSEEPLALPPSASENGLPAPEDELIPAPPAASEPPDRSEGPSATTATVGLRAVVLQSTQLLYFIKSINTAIVIDILYHK